MNNVEQSNNFTDTIFIKDNNNLEKQIIELKNIVDKVPDYCKNRVIYDIKKCERGLEGEKAIEFELKNADIGMYILQDIKLEYKDLNVQFDYIVITRGFVYLIECKNLIGDITVDENGQFIRKYTYDNIKRKEAIYSPYTQIIRHKDILKSILVNRNNNIRVGLQKKYFDIKYKPLVVVANNKSILDVKKAPKEVRDSTIRVDNLINYIKKDLKKYNKEYYANKEQMEELANSLFKRDVEQYHSIANNYNKAITLKRIESELKRFRRTRSKKMNIPLDYIFADYELSELLTYKPKDLSELKQILPEIKIKCHGKQIIKIINE